MSLRCGLIGLQSCGKTVIFNAITAAGVSGYNNLQMNQAVVNVPDHRLDRLTEMYHPLKTTAATLDVIDIAGIEVSHKGADTRSSRLLGQIKDVEALLHVVRCFEDGDVPFGYDTINPVRDVETVDLEMMAADSSTLANKINRLEKKVRVGDKDAIREANSCIKVRDAIQQGIPARRQGLSAQEIASVRECNLVSLKPVLYIANVKSMEDSTNAHVAALNQVARDEGAEMIIVSGKDEADISRLERGEQQEFLRDLGLQESSMERLIHTAYRMLGWITFFTTGEDEVRAWTCRNGDKAPVAAGKIHTDMEKGFIRMEVIRYEDLMGLGSESAVAKAGRERVEGREYQVQDGDIVSVRFNGKG